MKLAISFILFLFSQLSAGCAYAVASPHDGNIYSRSLPRVDNAQLEGTYRVRCYLLAHDHGQNREDTLLARVDDDDDEETINRRYLSTTTYFLAFTWLLISSDHFALQTEHLSIWRDVSCAGSCLYISQRVLRI